MPKMRVAGEENRHIGTRFNSWLALRKQAVKQQAAAIPSGPGGTPRAPTRFVQRESSDRIVALGLRTPWLRDLYHHLLTLAWPIFLVVLAFVYLGLNVLFAVLYLLGDGAIANARPKAFSDAFFFSVETISTIGYGQMSPATLYGNIVMTSEALVGLMLIAVAAGLMFARFSRPTARVMFSKVAVIAPHDGVPTLMLRLANERRNQILEAQVSMTLVRDERTAEGEWMRRFYDLQLARQRSPIFAMTFTVMHPIDNASPLWNATPSSLAAEAAEIVVTVTGIDENTVQPVHARTSYLAHEVLCDHRFADVFTQIQDGRLAIDYRRFHDTEPIEAAARRS
jgi:inward rectifier potassium channel